MDGQNSDLWQQFRSLALATCVALPSLAAVMCTERIPTPRPLADQRVVPALALQQYSVNLREVPAIGTVPARFNFTNSGNGPLTITKLDASCGCLAPKMTGGKKTFAPQENGEFTVSVKTANEKPGPKSYSVAVHYDDNGTPREQVVTFHLIIPERKVTVSPGQLTFYQLQGEAGSKVLHVTDERGRNLQITNVTTSSPNLEAVIGERKVRPDGAMEIPIQVHVAEGQPPGRVITDVTIHTDDVNYPKIQVPVMIEGKWQPIQQASGVLSPTN
ncbi:DUF1573 domain-containing protein [Planctomicrobium sp. SH664]|uniref:DUF1573 domain-containing protein n=1 Tax=Planctomicrobium sp. SH664 TaxID=3448125 RepID=UPI003F5BEF4F